MQRVVSEVCLSLAINLFVSISWAGMLMIRKMGIRGIRGIRGINLEKRYQVIEFSTLSSIDRYSLYMVVNSVLGGIQMGESSVHGSKTRTKQSNSQAGWILLVEECPKQQIEMGMWIGAEHYKKPIGRRECFKVKTSFTAE